jgi:hypothetical protein
MSDQPAKRLFPNPFYLVLLVASASFVLTILAYLVAPTVESGALRIEVDPDEPVGPARALQWFQGRAPLILAVECGAMFVFGVLAMATDRWFSPSTPGKPPWRG